jgi:hypothetical protein
MRITGLLAVLCELSADLDGCRYLVRPAWRKIGIQVLGEYSVTSVMYAYYYSHDSRRFDTETKFWEGKIP